MYLRDAVEILQNERKCVVKAEDCNRDCKNCELCRPSEDIIKAYDIAISVLSYISEVSGN